MNKYESVILINDNLTDKQKEETIKMVEKFIKENGKLTKTEVLGSKKMAYEIKGQKTACYCVLYFDAKANMISELERIYRITEEIIKFMTIKIEE